MSPTAGRGHRRGGACLTAIALACAAQLDPMDDGAAQMPSTVAGLGDPIGVGRTAKVFAHGDGEVVKLIRPGFPWRPAASKVKPTGVAGRLGDRCHSTGEVVSIARYKLDDPMRLRS